VSFDVQDGEVFYIIGQSGVGKTCSSSTSSASSTRTGGENLARRGEDIKPLSHEEQMLPVR